MKKILLISAFCLGMISLASAQQRTPAIQQRQHNQNMRLVHGVRNGELTRPETQRLAREQRHIRMEERNAGADGVVTRRERRHIRREQRLANREIYRQKHDGQDRN
jgi:hypothetical protein